MKTLVTGTSRTYIDDPDKSTKFYKGMARKSPGNFAGCKDPTLTIALPPDPDENLQPGRDAPFNISVFRRSYVKKRSLI
jgi:hypothetical protein